MCPRFNAGSFLRKPSKGLDSYRQCQPQQQRVSNEALAAIREALDLYRVLAAQKSAAFTPNLVTSTRVVADLHAGTPEVALGEWDTSIAAVPAPFRALVAVAATDWVHEQDDAARAQSFTATAIQAAEVDEQVNASTRQAIRRAIRGKLGDWKSTPVWSDWVTRHIPDPVLKLANAWVGPIPRRSPRSCAATSRCW